MKLSIALTTLLAAFSAASPVANAAVEPQCIKKGGACLVGVGSGGCCPGLECEVRRYPHPQ